MLLILHGAIEPQGTALFRRILRARPRRRIGCLRQTVRSTRCCGCTDPCWGVYACRDAGRRQRRHYDGVSGASLPKSKAAGSSDSEPLCPCGNLGQSFRAVRLKLAQLFLKSQLINPTEIGAAALRTRRDIAGILPKKFLMKCNPRTHSHRVTRIELASSNLLPTGVSRPTPAGCPGHSNLSRVETKTAKRRITKVRLVGRLDSPGLATR